MWRRHPTAGHARHLERLAMEEKRVKAIIFDLDNTLIETRRAGEVAIQKTRELLKATLALDDPAATIICDRFKQKLLQESFDPSAGRTIEEVRVGHWEESIRDVTGHRPAPSLAPQCYSLWKKARLEVLVLSPETRSLLKQLRASYKLLLLTNGVAEVQREKVRAAGCEELFDAVVIGGEHAEQKPSPSIFTLCFHMLDADAKDCVMVGDDLDADIQGGFNAGVRATVWISSSGRRIPNGSVEPDYTIATVLDLPGVLAQLETGL
ncbi:hypothetical protein fugu_012694 [Takifugu bimaculatus]|uniref:N-acetylneuraminic acid phosphatase n=2 Tax=Takifugu TaxID=31032 RepID=A0A4Z2C632_9TELE|nr:hypothetical protein fugu_012694 [Takifugu bimaculatus]